MSFDVDLFVIGGGSGGVRAARIAAGHGARVALAEESRMGGTCVIRGCVPKKLMVFAASARAGAEQSRGYAWADASSGAFDWPAFRARLDAELTRLEGVYRAGQTGAGVRVIDGRARLVDHHTVQVNDETITAKHILIATGGRPVRPVLPGADLAMVSDDVFGMERLPDRLLIVGGGYIACEFAGVFAGLGSKVVQAYRGTQILRGFDAEMADAAADQLVAEGVDLRVRLDLAAIERTAEGLRVIFDNGSTQVFDAVLFATGRVPNTADLGLENTGVKLGARGQIIVDEWSQTAVPSIFAVGDVTDRANLTPVAIREGHAFADTIFAATPRKVDHSLIASAVFTRPFELATIGMTEAEAVARGNTRIFATAFRPMRSAFAGSEARARLKLVVDVATDRVLGCHIFAPEAGEIIQMAAVAITMGATKADFDATMAVHPTLAEELVTMRQMTREYPGLG
ncbi:glutathione-disulfide reductase [Paracoccus sp. p3-h83]|uniref:glutathione-disulfide reductase n=1 Tax=Paracoccus sp. p3-h83 TaxID=3342805 RepID=UPI0035B7AAC9